MSDEHKTKQRFIRHRIQSGLVLLSFIFSGCGEARVENKVPTDTLTLGAYRGDTAALVWIAKDQGYFLDNGLDVTIREYEAGKLAADALLAGEVDIATTAEFVLVSNSFDREDLRILGSIATARTTELAARTDRGIRAPQDLIGKRVGVTQKSTGEFFLGSYLLFNGLSLEDIEVVDLRPSEIVEAIDEGEIDAAMTWDPNIYNIKKNMGDGIASWPGQSGQDFYFILVSRENWVQSHPETIERFLAAILQADAFARKHPTETRTIIRQTFGYDPEYIQYIWEKQDFMLTLPQELLIAMEDQARWMIENKLTPQATIPNYYQYIYLDGLEVVKPEAVTIIH